MKEKKQNPRSTLPGLWPWACDRRRRRCGSGAPATSMARSMRTKQSCSPSAPSVGCRVGISFEKVGYSIKVNKV